MIRIEKLTLYLETTVFNYYFDEDRDGHEDVVKLFEAIRAGEFVAYTSKYVIDELRQAPEPKRTKMLELANSDNVILLKTNLEARRMSKLYIERGIIPASQHLDSLHVATASVYEIACIVSYNFQHINRNKTKHGTTIINNEEGYGGIYIATAKEVLNDDKTTETL